MASGFVALGMVPMRFSKPALPPMILIWHPNLTCLDVNQQPFLGLLTPSLWPHCGLGGYIYGFHLSRLSHHAPPCVIFSEHALSRQIRSSFTWRRKFMRPPSQTSRSRPKFSYVPGSFEFKVSSSPNVIQSGFRD